MKRVAQFFTLALTFLVALPTFAQDPLSSWNDTAPKKAIVAFVEKVTKEGSADFVPVPERIATFDNDGCLWAEQPMYFQFLYAYKDEKNGVACVGGEAQYQRYQQLAVQQNIANQNLMAAQMQRDMAWGWHGAWGPGVWRPYMGSRVIIRR
jgi:acyl carrier protein phosphodiesterase